jgi:hypothetical protein
MAGNEGEGTTSLFGASSPAPFEATFLADWGYVTISPETKDGSSTSPGRNSPRLLGFSRGTT